MDLTKYKTIGEWFEDIKVQGYSAPLPMCHGLSKVMEKYNLSFHEAYKLLEGEGKIILKGKTFFFDLSASKLWEDNY